MGNPTMERSFESAILTPEGNSIRPRCVEGCTAINYRTGRRVDWADGISDMLPEIFDVGGDKQILSASGIRSGTRQF
jgi:hypothetical protein